MRARPLGNLLRITGWFFLLLFLHIRVRAKSEAETRYCFLRWMDEMRTFDRGFAEDSHSSRCNEG